MEPIISPWVLYWVSVMCNINDLVAIINWLSIMSIILVVAVHLVDYMNYMNGDERVIIPNWTKYIKISLIVTCVSGLLYIFIPDKQTMIAMITVSYITPDNINITADYVVELVQRISEAVNEVK